MTRKERAEVTIPTMMSIHISEELRAKDLVGDGFFVKQLSHSSGRKWSYEKEKFVSERIWKYRRILSTNFGRDGRSDDNASFGAGKFFCEYPFISVLCMSFIIYLTSVDLTFFKSNVLKRLF